MYPPKVYERKWCHYDGFNTLYRTYWFDGESLFYGQSVESEAKAAQNLDWFLWVCDLW